MIHDEAEEESREKEKWRSRDDACGAGVSHWLRIRVHVCPPITEAKQPRLLHMTTRVSFCSLTIKVSNTKRCLNV